jgi:hypothetical protein
MTLPGIFFRMLAKSHNESPEPRGGGPARRQAFGRPKACQKAPHAFAPACAGARRRTADRRPGKNSAGASDICPSVSARLSPSPALSLDGEVGKNKSQAKFSLSQLNLWGPPCKTAEQTVASRGYRRKMSERSEFFSPPAGYRVAREPDHRAVLPGVSFFGLPFLDKQER